MWTVEWNALSARIAGLIEAGGVYLTELTNRDFGQYDVCEDLLRNANGVFERLQRFITNHKDALPVRSTSMRTSRIWHHRGVSTRIA